MSSSSKRPDSSPAPAPTVGIVAPAAALDALAPLRRAYSRRGIGEVVVAGEALPTPGDSRRVGERRRRRAARLPTQPIAAHRRSVARRRRRPTAGACRSASCPASGGDLDRFAISAAAVHLRAIGEPAADDERRPARPAQRPLPRSRRAHPPPARRAGRRRRLGVLVAGRRDRPRRRHRRAAPRARRRGVRRPRTAARVGRLRRRARPPPRRHADPAERSSSRSPARRRAATAPAGRSPRRSSFRGPPRQRSVPSARLATSPTPAGRCASSMPSPPAHPPPASCSWPPSPRAASRATTG